MQYLVALLKKLAPGFMFAEREVRLLRAEVALLTSYTSDTTYRLRYDVMEYDYISPSVEKLLGYRPHELKQKNFRDLIIETKIVTDSIHKVDSFYKLEETRKKGEVCKWQADYKMNTKSGGVIWVSDVSYPWVDEKGKIIGSVGVLRDISDRVVAEEKSREELIKLANTDMLTGLANRRCFFDRVDDELKRAKRSKSDFSMLLIDIDHFKKVNDTFGHDAGDKVIYEVGSAIKSCLRETDMAARLGGEEFGVFLPDTPLEGAHWVAERIRKTVQAKKFRFPGNFDDVVVTVSIGVAESGLNDGTPNSHDIYKTAGTRLYIAKNTGRNQISVDELVHVH